MTADAQPHQAPDDGDRRRQRRPSALSRLGSWFLALMILVPAVVIGPRLMPDAGEPDSRPPASCAARSTPGLPCLVLRQVRTGNVLMLLGYIGLPKGTALTGASVELLGNRAKSSLEATGMRAISDGNGNFAFAVIDPVRFYAARLVGNAVYPASASAVLKVED